MIELPKADKKVLAILGLLLCLIAGFCFARIYQPIDKSVEIYTRALSDYNNKNYSNAYYLFSKIGRYSKLKPAALYRQGMCANALGDEKSEYLSYHNILIKFPASKLNTEARYRCAQLLLKTNPKKAKRYFTELILSNTPEEYKIASGYFKSKIEMQEFLAKPKKNMQSQIEDGFRTYLTKYPEGKYALDCAKSWLEFNPNMNSADSTIVARVFYNAQLYEDAFKILKRTNVDDSWAIAGAYYFQKNEFEKAKELTMIGVAKYSDIDISDLKRIVNLYITNSDNYVLSSSELFSLANGKNKDYLWSMKCKYAQNNDKYKCYEDLYASYQNGDYSQEAMINVIMGRIINKNYTGAKNMAESFITKYSESDNLPKVMFLLAKIEQIYIHSPNSVELYNQIINSFPDSYYAYRSYCALNNFKSALISSGINYQPVVYPYKYPSVNDIMYYLMLVNDYDMIDKFTDDEFIKSWTEYQRGNYTTSSHIAKKAMQELKIKPSSDDLRWRLVYPLNYFPQAQKEALLHGNNPALIISLIKEESYFNPEVQSGAGAMGLMQLMPATASDTAQKNGYQFNTSDLLNPEFNILLGNLYYADLRNSLNNNDILAVASYNGGMGAVQRWLKSFYYSDIDEFVEQIPYEETQNYVKKVFTSYWNYSRIYKHN